MARAYAELAAPEKSQSGCRCSLQVPADQREAFLLRHVEDVSYEDMSALTGAGISALKMRVKRACDSLRDRLRSETDDH